MSNLRYLILDGRAQKALFLLNNHRFTLHDLLKKDQEHNTPLHWAVKCHYEDVAQAILQEVGSLGRFIKNKLGQTPYDIAKQLGLSSHLLIKLNPKLIIAANTDVKSQREHG